MAPISLKIILDEGMVTRTIKFDSAMKVSEAYNILEEKLNVTEYHAKEYGLFLTSADNDLSGIWLESDRTLDYYMLRDGDSLLYLCKIRNLRVKTLDDSVKTVQVNEARPVGELMITICHRIGLTNHDEYGLCREELKESEEVKSTGTLTLKRKPQQREKDAKLEQLSKKLKTDDNVEWLDQRKTFREIGVHPSETLLLKRRLFYSDRRVDARDPVQLNLLYVQTKDAILEGRHPVTEKNAQLCKSRWINIRDMMRRKVRYRVRNPTTRTYKYKYEDELQFMLPFFKELSATNSNDDYTDFLDDSLNNCDDEMPTGIYVAEIDYGKDKDTKPNVATLRQMKRNEDDASINNKEFGTDTTFQELNSSDPIDGFLLTIGTTLRKFSPYYLNQAKSKIFQVVQDYELQQIVNKDDQANSSGNTDR